MSTNSPVETITCRDLHALTVEGPIDLIDVRSPEEYSERRAEMARSFPLDHFDPHAVHAARTTDPSQPIYFICEVGVRSEWACEVMRAAGYEYVVNVLGGTQAWEAAGLPIASG